MARYESKSEQMERIKQLPPSSIPRGTSFVNESGMIEYPQEGGVKTTFYPTTTGGKLDVFGIETPAGDAKDELEKDIAIRLQAYNKMNVAMRDMSLAEAGFVSTPSPGVSGASFDEETKEYTYSDPNTGKVVRSKNKPQISQPVAQPGDPFLYDLANQDYLIRQTKINAWEQHLRNSFNEIRKNEKFNDEEKMRLRSDAVIKMDDPIYIPKVPKRATVPALERSVGEVISNIQKNEYLNRQDFLYGTPGKNNGVYQMFGPNALRTVPGLREMADKYFPETTKPASVKQVSGRIRVQSPNGQVGYIPESQKDEAVANGYKVL